MKQKTNAKKNKSIQQAFKHIEKGSALITEGSKQLQEMFTAQIEYEIKPLQYRHEQEVKVIDVFLDIIKFISSVCFTIAIATHTVPQLKESNYLAPWLIGIPAIILLFLFYLRWRSVDTFIKAHTKLYNVIVGNYLANQKTVMKQTTLNQKIFTDEAERLQKKIKNSHKDSTA